MKLNVISGLLMKLLPVLAALLVISAPTPVRAFDPVPPAQLPVPNPTMPYWSVAPTPPMGWNSYDAFGGSVRENEVLANAQYIHDHLQSHGWQYVVIDYRWYDPGAHDPNADPSVSGIGSLRLTIDKNGRLMPSVDRFPSAADGHGFKALADKIHGMGLKFGIHIMRGIARLALRKNLPIEGSTESPWDVIGSAFLCPWDFDMFGVNPKKEGGQAYYDSLFKLYAGWGIDFVKIDDLSAPYSTEEIEAYRKSIDKCGRPIVFSTSPGETPVKEATHIMQHANMWRVSGDFWDDWKPLNHAFGLAYAWQNITGPGHWPDMDMLPIGHLSVNHRSVGEDRMTNFTHDEQITLLSLWSLASSPLILGADLSQMDPWTLSLITNDEVIAIDQDPLGHGPTRVSQNENGTEVWTKKLKDGSLAIGLFNRREVPATVTVSWSDAGLTGKQLVHNVWTHTDAGTFDNEYSSPVPPHGTVLLKVSPAKS